MASILDNITIKQQKGNNKMAAETLLETHKLTKSFQGKTIIDNLNLNIKKGMYMDFWAEMDKAKQQRSEC
ncbi:hypothetical protein J18TS1_04920 [Oceanobacillus oncorhynchi subsp. incaldanensis]|nr:hypothetical protein J18TS1_04920 [Oceanobacillus oncorhynchi subsp. incaldanensis]